MAESPESLRCPSCQIALTAAGRTDRCAKCDGAWIHEDVLVGILQERRIAIDPQRPAAGTMPFEGGCTIVADLRRLAIRYCIRKSVTSANREQRQQAFTRTLDESSHATYFGVSGVIGDAEPLAVIHRGL